MIKELVTNANDIQIKEPQFDKETLQNDLNLFIDLIESEILPSLKNTYKGSAIEIQGTIEKNLKRICNKKELRKYLKEMQQ
jgi:hypothetical protein